MNPNVYEKVYGCLCGGIIGDALGAPTEGMHYDEIAQKYGWVEEFAGAGTDDSAIKQILCQAILEHGGYVTADEWAEAFLKNKDNYYPLFYIPVRNMFHKLESRLSLPVYAGMGNMHSSSSAMSISPMGIINACDPRQAAVETTTRRASSTRAIPPSAATGPARRRPRWRRRSVRAPRWKAYSPPPSITCTP
jgi:ADP-ribosylglycohydrolase